MFPVHRKYLVGLTDLEIVSVYNAELRGICNYYGMVSNFCRLHYFAYLMEYSCLKILALKHKTSLSKTIDKFNDGTRKWGIPYETKLKSKRRYFANYADCKGKGRREIAMIVKHRRTLVVCRDCYRSIIHKK